MQAKSGRYQATSGQDCRKCQLSFVCLQARRPPANGHVLPIRALPVVQLVRVALEPPESVENFKGKVPHVDAVLADFGVVEPRALVGREEVHLVVVQVERDRVYRALVPSLIEVLRRDQL